MVDSFILWSGIFSWVPFHFFVFYENEVFKITCIPNHNKKLINALVQNENTAVGKRVSVVVVE